MKEKVILSLVEYGLTNGLIEKTDVPYVINRMLHILELESIDVNQTYDVKLLDDIFDDLWSVMPDMMGYQKDAIRCHLMDVLTHKPSTINKMFNQMVQEDKINATNWFYDYCKKIDYVKSTKANVLWSYDGDYGSLQLTINLAKPEKDPREIALLLKQGKSNEYPSCMLCKENIGYYGMISKPARSNLRVLPITLNQEPWMMQYSPYAYYNEHLIVFKQQHEPMLVNKDTFIRLLDFVDYLPHYFIGSNAGLPIVGGSILNHDHFQGGRHVFPLMEASSFYEEEKDGFSISCLNWYMATVQIKTKSKEKAIAFMQHFYEKWLCYENKELEIIPNTGNIPHQAITPIVKKVDDVYEVYLVPRNNRTNDMYPDGIFHPHPNVHHIKKENIGLIEVLGCAILPGRLKTELSMIHEVLKGQDVKDDSIDKHREWIKTFDQDVVQSLTDETRQTFLLTEVAKRFELVLRDASVFKDDTKGRDALVCFVKDVVNSFEHERKA